MAKLFYDEIPTEQTVTAYINRENSSAKPQDIYLHLLMRKITSDFETVLEDFFGQHGITTSRFIILNMLFHNEAGMTPTETAKKVGVTNATISAILSGLKDSGLIQSTQNAGDSRSYRVTLSPAGTELLKKIYPVYHDNISKLWSHFDTEEKTQIGNMLTRFSQVMGVLGNKF
ncbi:MarR family winged helix-turn-helix transcriptional regulator [Bdellovibrio sp. NC01]|uniref:MarR family winged helix-turn-helix transcriptional regulator n=1 Tax=Bdellovibrio sp. NC01 TaxID=2220073 RepID=UPI001157DB06|nr:MarR family transcriptional regulator [Bdellovibrio sp. NC01]QDK38411.1 hypothetical protein DOE51_12910 [Bdellovibrio sp. NC01]